MNQLLKTRVCIIVLAIPYVFFSIALLSDFFFFLGIITLLPFSTIALLLKKIWKVQFEDGTTKGDLKLLLFGTLAFIGIPFGILAWMIIFVVTS